MDVQYHVYTVSNHTQARTLQGKDKWVKTIKLLLMESIPHLPDKVLYLHIAMVVLHPV